MRTRVLTSLFIFVCINLGSIRALDNISIRITPDEFPQDISWELQNGDYNTLVKTNINDCSPFVLCSRDFLFSEEECYRFIIEDKQVDKNTSPWEFEVLLNGEVVISKFMTDSLFIGSFGCDSKGKICEEADIINPDSTRISWPPVENFWFSYTPKETGLLQLLNCDLNADRRYPETKMWIYDRCLRDQSDSPEGAIAFSEKFSFCPPSSGINAIPVKAGTEYFIRLSLIDNITWRDSIELSIEPFDNNPGCTDPIACNYYPFATSDDGSCFYEDCSPDLEIDQLVFEESILFDSIEQSDACLIAEGCLRGPGLRYIVRFSTLIKNIGNADYVIGSPEENESNFSNENCHQHFHHLGYAEYMLFAGNGDPEPIGFKNGFCVQDSECPTSLQRYFCNYMGITAGCEDLYGNDILCQWVDITDVPDGQYTLVARINWSRLPDIRGFYESTYDNNWAQVCIEITRTNNIPTIELLAVCDQYHDCLGKAFGQAEIDCNNICGGNAHFGDINQNGELDEGDIDEYLFSLSDQSLSTGSCFDLNRDGDISVYDILLANECLYDRIINEDNLFHEHCILPSGQFQELDSLRLNIEDIDTTNKTIKIAYTSPQRDIISLELMMEGIQISEFEFNRTARFTDFNQNQIFIYHTSPLLQRNSVPEEFLIIHYDSIQLENVCISEVEGINSLMQEVYGYSGFETNCAFLTHLSDFETEVPIKIQPNPADHFLYIRSLDAHIETIQIYSVDGKKQYEHQKIFSSNIDIDVSLFPKGIYLIHIVTNNLKRFYRKVIIQ